MLGLPRLGLELLVVLEVGLERGGVHGPRVQQVIEDEVAHLAHRLEVEGLDQEPVEGLGQRAEAVPDLVAIRPGIREQARLRDLADGGPKLAQRAHEVAGGDGGHITHARAWQDDVDAAHAAVGLGGFHRDPACEITRGVPFVGKLEQDVRGARPPAEAHLTGPRLVLRPELPAHVAIEVTPAMLVGGLVEARLLLVGDERPLEGVEDGGFPAAVVTEEETTTAEAQRFVGEVIPIHEPDRLQPDHAVSSPVSGSASASSLSIAPSGGGPPSAPA